MRGSVRDELRSLRATLQLLGAGDTAFQARRQTSAKGLRGDCRASIIETSSLIGPRIVLSAAHDDAIIAFGCVGVGGLIAAKMHALYAWRGRGWVLTTR